MERIAIISDIHANVEALEAVLDAIYQRGVDGIFCLGDIVGYGTNPSECVDLVRYYCDGVVRGNHDEAVATERGLKSLPRDGEKAAIHNRRLLSTDQLAYLANLPLKIEALGSTFVHATPDEPGKWRRMDTYPAIREQFGAFETDLCFVGHSHLPGVVSERVGVFRVRRGCRFIVNVGSVGKPRDGDTRAGLTIFNRSSFTLEQLRIPYDAAFASRKLKIAGLPTRLAKALAIGH